MPINYVIGDATQPHGLGPKVICHCVNDIGHFGAGFAGCIKVRWPRVEVSYRAWHRAGRSSLVVNLTPGPAEVISEFHLGSVQLVQVEPELWVANIIGQHRTIRYEPMPIRYEALERGLEHVATFCRRHGASIHAPKLGAGLARGRWELIEAILERTLAAHAVTIYTPGRR